MPKKLQSYGIIRFVGSLIPDDKANRLALIIALAVAVGFAIPSKPVSRSELSQTELSQTELETAKWIAANDGVSLQRAKAMVINARPSPEQVRRARFESEERDRQATAIHVGLCADQPWLDRCN